MKPFSEMGIKPATVKTMVGNKINLLTVLNREIVVHDYVIKPSKFSKDGESKKCLYLQISIGETKHVLFTGYGTLMEMIEQVPKENFPFTTTILKKDERFQFT